MEFTAAIREVEERRLREVRLWVLANTLIFIVTAPTLHLYRWNRLDYKGQAALISAAAVQVPITACLVLSFFGHLELTYFMLLLQSLQTLLFNYLSFSLDSTNNFQVNNVLLTAMSSIFLVCNTFLFSRLTKSLWCQALVAFTNIGCVIVSVIYSNYRWEYTRRLDILFVIFMGVIGIVMVLIFGYI